MPADDIFVAITATASPVTLSVSSSGGLTLTHGGYAPGSLSGTGLRSRTMALTSGADSGKTVVYTDRELSRSVLEHFGDRRDPANMARFLLNDPLNLGGAGDEIDHFTGTPPATEKWRISHNVTTSVAGEDLDGNSESLVTPVTPLADASTENTRMAASYTGYLYGQAGAFCLRRR